MKILSRAAVAGLVLALAVPIATAAGAGARSASPVTREEARHLCDAVALDLATRLGGFVRTPAVYNRYYARGVGFFLHRAHTASRNVALAVVNDCLDSMKVLYFATKRRGPLSFDRVVAAYERSPKKAIRTVGRAFIHDVSVVRTASRRLDDVMNHELPILSELLERASARDKATLTNYIRFGITVAQRYRY